MFDCRSVHCVCPWAVELLARLHGPAAFLHGALFGTSVQSLRRVHSLLRPARWLQAVGSLAEAELAESAPAAAQREDDELSEATQRFHRIFHGMPDPDDDWEAPAEPARADMRRLAQRAPRTPAQEVCLCS